MHIALISFLTNSLSTRTLSSHIKRNGFKSTCLFCQEEFNQTNLEALISLLKKLNISMVGISTVTDDFKKAVHLTAEIKKYLKIPVIWGGSHVNVRPEESLGYADIICMGEGEDALLDLLRNWSQQKHDEYRINNIWFNTPNGIVRNELRCLEEDIDRYPMPDFDVESMLVMDATSFKTIGEKHLNYEYSVMSSRGCPYSCTYCYNSYRRRQYKGKGKYLRTRKIEKVIEELALARKKFPGIRKINFMDDSFIARKVDDFKLFKQLYTEQINLPFYALAEPMAFDFRKVSLLADCGLSELQIGIQSGSERTNNEVYKRKISNEKVLKIAQFVHEKKISVVYDLIFNNPYESTSDLKDTIDLLLKFPQPFSLQGYNLIFYPETRLTDMALNDGKIEVRENEDANFDTIESKCDSPIAMRGKGKTSSRFYNIHFDSKEKEYFNSVISLFAYNHVPRFVIKFFRTSDKPLMQALLEAFNKLYHAAHFLKQGFRG